MEIFGKKNIVLKIVIALVIVILFNFAAPTISRADDLGEIIGGTLLTPIVDLLLAIGDGIMYTIQKMILGMDSSLIKVSNEWSGILAWGAAILSGALVIGLAIVTCGVSLVVGAVAVAAAYAGYKIAADQLPPTFHLPIYAISPEEIFANQIALLDVNFFNPNQYQTINMSGVQSNTQISSAGELQSTIASWYLALRNFALVVLLSILLYTGIKIIISSSAQDKAKYKEKLFSWIVAVCLLFFMHYIMSFATTVVQEVTNGINRANGKVEIQLPDLSAEDYDVEVVENGESKRVAVKDWFQQQNTDPPVYDGGNYRWYTNLMGKVRLEMQLEDPSITEDNEILSKAGYTIMFLILVFYTIAFLVVYLKRLIMLAFLTMIAPLVAMTYSLDKMQDGNAKAFNLWIKEYVFNLLIQPFHLILYTMLVGSAMQFASDHIIYGIVAIGFIFQAEKLLRKFFGFDNASTISNGSAIGGALAMAGMGALRKMVGGGSKNKSKGGKGNSNESGDNGRVRRNRTSELLDEAQENEGQGNAQQRMLEADDENYGTNNWDPQERDARAREAYAQENSSGMQPSREEYEQILRDSGHEEDEIQRLIAEDPRYNMPEPYDPESDTRGMGQWINDMYQGSRLQSGIHTVTKPARFVRDKVAQGVNSVRELAGKGVRKFVPKPIRNTIRGAATVGANGLKYVAPRAAKLYAKGVAAATLGGIGVAAGLASDDDMNILKYGAAGAGAGWMVGSGAINATQSADGAIRNAADNAASTYTIAAKGLDAEKARKMAAEERAAMKDKDRQKLYAEKLGLKNNKEIKAALEDARKFRENGVMDDKVIIKAMQAEGFGDERASKERMILAGLATETGNDNKKIKDLQGRLQERGLDEKDVKKYIDGVRDITGAI